MAAWAITAVQGGTIRRTLTFTNDDGSTVDITGWQWRAALIGRNVNLAPQIAATGPGAVTVTIPKEMSAGVPAGVYQLVIDWVDASGATPEEEIVGTVTLRAQMAR